MEIEVFEIEYRYYAQHYNAEVTRVGNEYRVSPEEPAHAEIFGEYVFTEQNRKFLYTRRETTHMEYLIAIDLALQKRAGYL